MDLLDLDLGFEFCIDCNGFSDDPDVMVRMVGAFESCLNLFAPLPLIFVFYFN